MSVNASPKFWVVSNFARGGFVLTCNFVVIHVEWFKEQVIAVTAYKEGYM